MVFTKAARVIFNVHRMARITPYLIKLHWLPIKARIEYKICTMTYKVLKSNSPLYLRELLKNFNPQLNVRLRHQDDNERLSEESFRTNYAKRSFKIIAPKFYNLLPSEIKVSENIKIFKKKLKTYLFRKAYQLDDETISVNYRTV